MSSEALRKAKTIICEEAQRYGVDVRHILLFGSRARGDARPDSDWDFLIVIDRPLERSLQRRLATTISVRLVLERIPSDVLLLPASQFDQHKGDVGHIAYYVHKEGVLL
ncbi:nucleotidyltransferase domain-containing protein [Chloroflexus sp.]|uniref:nucleotidyltransferase domain-containing protein n=1 Tax=Chloroflexus sp. TaxID=1904827 RepID=UPI0029F5DF00|nr:nucleotidyltransferase domain-containing protein [Chloroflexus sp.]MCS6886879.1 nucleotidyltransferase domain-containing protein [Chloroflexus sp.]MCX7858759.1 nucleotidyltransferase domain-containing protein [Chloroflexus sp.]